MLNIKKAHRPIFAGAVENKPKPAVHPRGSVLVYTIVVLLLMTLMGAALMVNSRTELQISSSTFQGRDAFTKADATAQVALLFTRAYLHPTAGDPRDYLNSEKSGEAGRKPFEVHPDDFLQSLEDLQSIKDSITVDEIRERYLRITEAKDTPHLKLTYGEDSSDQGSVVGTSFVGLAYNSSPTGGGSIGERDYSAPDSGFGIIAFFVVSSQGRVAQGENKGYIEEGQAGAHSIVTSIFREVLP